jgi:hypothetical protein
VPLVLEPVPEVPVCDPALPVPVLPVLAPAALPPPAVPEPEEPEVPCAMATPPIARAAAAARVVRVFLVVLMLNSLMQTPKGKLVEKSRQRRPADSEPTFAPRRPRVGEDRQSL